jgi:hypothetical protein
MQEQLQRVRDIANGIAVAVDDSVKLTKQLAESVVEFYPEVYNRTFPEQAAECGCASVWPDLALSGVDLVGI